MREYQNERALAPLHARPESFLIARFTVDRIPRGTRGKHYYRARYYHTDLQRFISEDPLGLAGAKYNLYAYVDNSPLSFVDPLGLEKCSDTAGDVLRSPISYINRIPDYYTVSWFALKFGRTEFFAGGSFTIDRNFNAFFGGGLSVSRSWGVMAGWVARSDFNEDKVNDLVTEVSFTGTVTPPGLHNLSGGVTWSPRSACHAVEIGIAGSSGASGTYGKRLGNLRNLPAALGF